MMVGGPPGAPAQRVPGTVIADPVGGGSRTTAHADRFGQFELRLAPGTYTLSGSSPKDNEGKGVCRADHSVTVRDGMTLSAVVVCSIV